MKLITFSKPIDLYGYARQCLKNGLVNGDGNVAICGGSTPLPLFSHLGENVISDDGVMNVYWTDERLLPFSDDQNNAKHAIERWLQHEPQANIHRVKTNLSASEAISDYERILPERLDLVLLGMGMDGHIASLFPNQEYPSEKTGLVRHPEDDSSRLTLSLDYLADAKQVFLFITGFKKKQLLETRNDLPIHDLFALTEVTVFHHD